MKVIILVGGLGTRLNQIIKDIPKPMAIINGKPFLEFLMKNMIKFGATEFILCVGHKRDVIINYFNNNFKNIPIKYSIEEKLLGTGGAIKQAFDIFNIDKAIVINGDTYVEMDYQNFYNQMNNEKLALTLKYINDASRYGLVNTDKNRVINFEEKKESSEAGFINAGVYYISKELFVNYNLPKNFSFEKDFLEKNIKLLKPKYYQTEDYFIDIGIPESYKKACFDLSGEIANEK